MLNNPITEIVKLANRIAAAENILAGLYANFNRITGVSKEQFAKDIEELRTRLKFLALQEDPALSDSVTAEVQEAYEPLLQKLLDYGPSEHSSAFSPRDVRLWRKRRLPGDYTRG